MHQRVVAIVELTDDGEGVAGHEDTARVETSERLDVLLLHRMGLRDDDKEVRGVESLEAERLVGTEADGEMLLVESKAGGIVEPAAYRGPGIAVCST